VRTLAILAAVFAAYLGLRRQIMAVSAQIQAFSDRVNTATNEIAADLKALRDKIAAGTALTPEDVAVLDGLASRLEAMGADPSDPVPNA
jgi:hypothetical protein